LVQAIPSEYHKLIPVFKRVYMHSKNCTIQERATLSARFRNVPRCQHDSGTCHVVSTIQERATLSARFGNTISVQKRTVTFWLRQTNQAGLKRSINIAQV